MKLEPNTYLGLTWGLINFDGIETDIRLTKDENLVIYHDAHLPSGEYIEDLTIDELDERGIPTLNKFFSLPKIVSLSESKSMFIELKPNCRGDSRVTTEIADTFYRSFQKVMESTEIDQSSIHIISFAKDLLDPFVDDYPCYPLLPDVNECSQKWVTIKAMPQVLGVSLAKEIKKADDSGYAGVFFARQYVMGWTSFRHPSYEKAVELASDRDMLLGTNLGSPELEGKYPAFARFSDNLSQYPRYGGEENGPIIAHRGTGTKGVEVQDEDVPDLAI